MRLPFNGNFPISQVFGNKLFLKRSDSSTYDVYAQWGYQGHNGIDYALPTGTPVFAPHSGEIKEAAFDRDGYGNYVKLENEAEGSVLAHLDTITVRVGFMVNEGDLIGYSDSTGLSTAPHLHWGYYRMPRNRANGYGGFIDQTPFLPGEKAPVVETRFKVGQILRPMVDVPVGAEPGKETFGYGRVGINFPGEITDIRMFNGKAYYNISQVSIGGGTGWVDSKVVDALPIVNQPQVEPPAVPVEAPKKVETPKEEKQQPPQQQSKLYTQEEYLALQQRVTDLTEERNNALEDLKELTKQYNDIYGFCTGFKAMGFETVDDLVGYQKAKEKTIIGLNEQLSQTLERNKKLAEMVAEKDNEDSTAIEEGIKALNELEQLREEMVLIAKEVNAKPNVFDILDKMNGLRKSVQSVMKKAQQEADEAQREINEQRKAEGKPVDESKNSFQWLLGMLGLTG